MKFKNILDPEGQVYFFNKIDKIFKNKLLNNSGCRNDCGNIKILHCCIYWRFNLFIFGGRVDCEMLQI